MSDYSMKVSEEFVMAPKSELLLKRNFLKDFTFNEDKPLGISINSNRRLREKY